MFTIQINLITKMRFIIIIDDQIITVKNNMYFGRNIRYQLLIILSKISPNISEKLLVNTEKCCMISTPMTFNLNLINLF